MAQTKDELDAEALLLEAKRARDAKEAEAITAAATLAAAKAAADPDLIARKKREADEKAILDAQKENLALRKANSDATAAQAAADKAEIQNKFGGVPDAPESAGSIDIKEGAGKGEATLLAAIATEEAANTIARRVSFSKGVVLVAGTAKPLFDDWDQFDVGTKIIGEQLDRAHSIYVKAGQDFPAAAGVVGTGSGVSREFISPLAAGTALESIAKLGQFFQSKYTAGGIALTADNELLLSAVADALVRKTGDGRPTSVTSLAFNPTARPGAKILPILTALALKVDQANEDADAADRRAATLKKELETASAAEKPDKQRGSAAYERAAAASRAAASAYQTFANRILAEDEKGRLPISRIAEAKEAMDALGRGDSVLFVNMSSSVGGYYTRTSLWTFLGTIPYRVMGGVVVSYTAIASSGQVTASGVVPVHGGYRTIPAVKALVDESLAKK